MSSKRYPGKVLEKIYNDQNILEIIINNLKKKNYTLELSLLLQKKN